MSSDYGPQIKLTRLYERTSKSGNRYFSGRLGAAKILVFKSRDTTDDGAPIWDVVLNEAKPSEPKVQRAETNSAAPTPIDQRSGFDKQLDDEIPF